MHTENRTLRKEIEEDSKNGKIFHAHGLEESILLKCPHYQSNLQIQCNPYQNSNDIFHSNRKKILQFVWNHKNPLTVLICLSHLLYST